jgi:hypothetical protein
MNSIESIPQVWDDDHDSRFFRITASIFSTSYCSGAGVLLASYDTDDDLFAVDFEPASYDVEPVGAPTTTATSSTPVDHTAS